MKLKKIRALEHVFELGSNLKKASVVRKMAFGCSKLFIRYEGIAGVRPISDSRHMASPLKLLSYGWRFMKELLSSY
jgi:hypothetical protein